MDCTRANLSLSFSGSHSAHERQIMIKKMAKLFILFYFNNNGSNDDNDNKDDNDNNDDNDDNDSIIMMMGKK